MVSYDDHDYKDDGEDNKDNGEDDVDDDHNHDQVHHFHAKSSLSGFEAAIVGSVPLGGGVSSSASVEVIKMIII